MTIMNRSFGRLTFLCACFAALVAFRSLPRICAQEPTFPPILNEMTAGGSVPRLFDPNADFTDEHFRIFESYLDIPTDKDYNFYLFRLDALASSRASLCSRWYNRRAAELVEKIDVAIEETRTLYEEKSQIEREKIFDQFNSLTRSNDVDALRDLINHVENPKSGWRVVADSTIAEMYEAYYGLRIQESALANNRDALQATLDEIINTNNPTVAQCAENLVELVSIYDAELAPQFILQAFSAYRANQAPEVRNVSRPARQPRLFKPTKGVDQTVTKFFDVPDDRDLEFYRNLYQEIRRTPAVKADSNSTLTRFIQQREEALEKTLRHIVMITFDSPEGVKPEELEQYKSYVLLGNKYPQALELYKMGAISLDSRSIDKDRFAMTVRNYFCNALQRVPQANPKRRREIISEFTDALANKINVFPAYESYRGTVSYHAPEFEKELRAAICEVGLKSDDPEIVMCAKRWVAPEKTLASIVGQTLDLRGLDVNMQPFDVKKVGDKPIVLIVTTQPSLLLQADSSRLEQVRTRSERGELAIVGYLTSSSTTDAVLKRGANAGQFAEELNRLRQKKYPILLQGLAQYSNDMTDTDYPILGDAVGITGTNYVLLNGERKIVGVYTLNDLESGNAWKLEQHVDNLIRNRDSR